MRQLKVSFPGRLISLDIVFRFRVFACMLITSTPRNFRLDSANIFFNSCAPFVFKQVTAGVCMLRLVTNTIGYASNCHRIKFFVLRRPGRREIKSCRRFSFQFEHVFLLGALAWPRR